MQALGDISFLQVHDRSAPSKKVVIWDVEHRQKQITAFDVDIKVCSLQLIHEHPCFQMLTCRGGYWFFWGCIKLYSILGLKSYSGNPSTWVYESSNGLRYQLQAHGCHGKHVIASRRSFEASGTALTPRCVDPSSSALPGPVMSSVCLLNCLLVWEWQSHNSMDPDRPKLKLQQ